MELISGTQASQGHRNTVSNGALADDELSLSTGQTDSFQAFMDKALTSAKTQDSTVDHAFRGNDSTITVLNVEYSNAADLTFNIPFTAESQSSAFRADRSQATKGSVMQRLFASNVESTALDVIAMTTTGSPTVMTEEIVSRIFEFSALANGYLSQQVEISKHHPVDDKQRGQHAVDQRQAPLQITHLALNATERNAQISVFNTNVQHALLTMSNRPNGLIEQSKQIALDNTLLNMATKEYARQHFMLTENEAGNTLWYRDFGLTDADKSELQTWLTSVDFVKQHQLARVFVNGNLLWQQSKKGTL